MPDYTQTLHCVSVMHSLHSTFAKITCCLDLREIWVTCIYYVFTFHMRGTSSGLMRSVVRILCLARATLTGAQVCRAVVVLPCDAECTPGKFKHWGKKKKLNYTDYRLVLVSVTSFLPPKLGRYMMNPVDGEVFLGFPKFLPATPGTELINHDVQVKLCKSFVYHIHYCSCQDKDSLQYISFLHWWISKFSLTCTDWWVISYA